MQELNKSVLMSTISIKNFIEDHISNLKYFDIFTTDYLTLVNYELKGKFLSNPEININFYNLIKSIESIKDIEQGYVESNNLYFEWKIKNDKVEKLSMGKLIGDNKLLPIIHDDIQTEITKTGIVEIDWIIGQPIFGISEEDSVNILQYYDFLTDDYLVQLNKKIQLIANKDDIILKFLKRNIYYSFISGLPTRNGDRVIEFNCLEMCEETTLRWFRISKIVGDTFLPLLEFGDTNYMNKMTEPNYKATPDIKVVDLLELLQYYDILTEDALVYISTKIGEYFLENSLNQRVLKKIFTKLYPTSNNRFFEMKFKDKYIIQSLKIGIFDNMIKRILIKGEL